MMVVLDYSSNQKLLERLRRTISVHHDNPGNVLKISCQALKIRLNRDRFAKLLHFHYNIYTNIFNSCIPEMGVPEKYWRNYIWKFLVDETPPRGGVCSNGARVNLYF